MPTQTTTTIHTPTTDALDAVISLLKCSICDNLMLEPVRAHCGHAFACRECTQRHFRSNNGILVCPICNRKSQEKKQYPIDKTLGLIVKHVKESTTSPQFDTGTQRSIRDALECSKCSKIMKHPVFEKCGHSHACKACNIKFYDSVRRGIIGKKGKARMGDARCMFCPYCNMRCFSKKSQIDKSVNATLDMVATLLFQDTSGPLQAEVEDERASLIAKIDEEHENIYKYPHYKAQVVALLKDETIPSHKWMRCACTPEHNGPFIMMPHVSLNFKVVASCPRYKPGKPMCKIGCGTFRNLSDTQTLTYLRFISDRP